MECHPPPRRDLASHSPAWWPERLAAFLSIAGVLISIFLNFHVYTWQQSGSDFKTLYASAQCLTRGLNAYTFNNIAAVFHSNGITAPSNWYAHAPVYPPFTLAALAPFTWIGMAPAVYLFTVLSAAAIAVATISLCRSAAFSYGLTRPWRLAMIAVAAASPMLSFGLEMGNVSVLVSALGIFAVTASPGSLLAPIALAFALLLKPHLAIWIAIALLALRRRADRTLALRSLLVFAVLASAVALWLVAHGQFAMQFNAYRDVVRAELVGGSMAPANHEHLAVAAQITSLESFLAYFIPGGRLVSALDLLGLLGIGVALLRASYKLPANFRLPLIAAWSIFGMLATYHRAHDAVFFIVALPWLVARLRTSLRDPIPYAVVLLYLAMALGTTWETLHALALRPNLHALALAVLYRQAPAAALLLMLLLLAVFYVDLRGTEEPASRRTRASEGESLRSGELVSH